MGRNCHHLHFTWGVDYARPSGDTWSSGQHSWTPLPVPAFLSIVASVPTTQYWSVVRMWARQSVQWGDVPVCHGAMDSKQNVNVSGRKKVGCTSLPAWRHFYTLLHEMGSAFLCEDAELSMGNEYLRGCQVLCRFGLSLGPLASGRLDPTLASFCSLTLVITP